MTRKRFIKIMQSKGLQRNKAVELAKQVREYGGVGISYEAAAHGELRIEGKKAFYSVDIPQDVALAYMRKRKKSRAAHREADLWLPSHDSNLFGGRKTHERQ